VSTGTPLARLREHAARDESGLSTLEWLGIVAVIITIIAFIPAARGLLGDAYDAIFKRVDETTGEISQFSVAARGILITVTAFLAFIGSAYLLLYTDLGARLGFLVAGAGVFGWLVIGGALFVTYAPRGLRPRTVEGLNAFQIRIPAIAMTLGAAILFVMFVIALDRYEKEDDAEL
jgi:hypothetical protein